MHLLLFPYRKCELRSPLSVDEATRALVAAVEPGLWFGARDKRPFVGNVAGTTFHIRRVTWYRSAFLPQIHGTIAADGVGSSVSFTMKPSLIAAIFLAVWAAIVSAMICTSFTRETFAPESLTPVALHVFAWAAVLGTFAFEATKSQKLLKGIFGANG